MKVKTMHNLIIFSFYISCVCLSPSLSSFDIRKLVRYILVCSRYWFNFRFYWDLPIRNEGFLISSGNKKNDCQKEVTKSFLYLKWLLCHFLPFISYRKSQQRLLVIISHRRINKCVHFLKPSMLFFCAPLRLGDDDLNFFYTKASSPIYEIFSLII